MAHLDLDCFLIAFVCHPLGGSDCTNLFCSKLRQAVLATDPMRSLRKEMQLSGLWRHIAQALGDLGL